MCKYYVMAAVNCIEDYVVLGEVPERFSSACLKSEFQFIDKNPVSIELSAEGGNVFPDFIYQNQIPLISDRLKNFFDSLKIDYLFYKKVNLTKEQLGIEEPYWLALPQRIDCLDRNKSEIDDFFNEAEKIVVNDNQVGRFEIFKLSGVINSEIIISERIANLLEKEKFKGINIYSLSGE